MRFSEQYGHVAVRNAIQIDSMNQQLRNGIWSLLTIYIWDNVRCYGTSFFETSPAGRKLFTRLWLYYWKLPIDTLRDDWNAVLGKTRLYFFECEWFEAYDFVEFIAQNYPSYPFTDEAAFVRAVNSTLTRECAACRLVNGSFVKITAEEEISEIESALAGAKGPVQIHLQRALELLSNREKPDYRNSIKESISAIESLVAIALGEKGTLGQLIKKMEDEIGLHPALRSAFSSLYGYTSDEAGIRHAIMESENVNFEEAKFFLVVCSTFINFVNAKLALKG